MSSLMPAGAGTLLRHRSFVLFLLSRSLSRFSSQIAQSRSAGRSIDLTGSAFDLGMVGLVHSCRPRCWCSSPARRPTVTSASRVVQALPARRSADGAVAGMGAYAGWLTVAQIFIATAVLGTAGAFESPATAALLPLIVPQGSLQRAIALRAAPRRSRPLPDPRWGPRLCRDAEPALRHHGAVLADRSDPDRGHPSGAAGRVRDFRDAQTICLPGSGSSATIPAILGTISLDLFAVLLGARRRCCRSMPATSSRPARWASALCARRRGRGFADDHRCCAPQQSTAGSACACSGLIVFGCDIGVRDSHWMWLFAAGLAVLGAAIPSAW